MILHMFWILLSIPAGQSNPSQISSVPAAAGISPETTHYGQAEVSEVLRVLPDFHLVCNIRSYPPVVGKQMPVSIRGLHPGGTEADEKVRSYLQTLLCTQSKDPNQLILLKNIQRGDTFCLVADVEINGRDLGDYLVEKGLVERILQAPVSESKPEAASKQSPAAGVLQPIPAAAVPAQPGPPTTQGYIASKNSRIFHRAGCPHAARIAEEQRLVFRTRQEAAVGRRPCKTCNP
jgi:hypothetical protein